MKNNIRLPKEIENDIEVLRYELEISKSFYEYSFVCNEETFGDKIGFYNLTNLSKLLKLLHEGRKLKGEHQLYGTFYVTMNTQKNRFIVSTDLENSPVNEETILVFMCRYPVTWYVKTISDEK